MWFWCWGNWEGRTALKEESRRRGKEWMASSALLYSAMLCSPLLCLYLYPSLSYGDALLTFQLYHVLTYSHPRYRNLTSSIILLPGILGLFLMSFFSFFYWISFSHCFCFFSSSFFSSSAFFFLDLLHGIVGGRVVGTRGCPHAWKNACNRRRRRIRESFPQHGERHLCCMNASS